VRIVTWNCCRGAYRRKADLLAAFAPHLSVLQECAKPETETKRRLWFGDNPRQGVLVQAAPPYQLAALPCLADVPKFVVPVSVTGPVSFNLLAVWAKGKQDHCYVEGVIQAVAMYRSLLTGAPAILIGDLNSNAIWDASHRPGLNHTGLVETLSRLGLVSAYHSHFGEAHGQETRPTYFFQWNEARPFHLDYCFLPKAWAGEVRRVEVGSYDEWKGHSDHRPLLVEIRWRRGGGARPRG